MAINKLLGTVCLAALSLSAAPALAGGSLKDAPAPVMDSRQWYVTAFGGWAAASDHNFDFVSGAGALFHYNVSHDDGYTFGGAVGVIVSPSVRIEVEVAHSAFDYGNDYTGPGFIGLGENGSVDLTTVLVNAWFNTNIGGWMPYIGGGVGAGFADGELSITNGAGAQFNGDDVGVAFQFGAGVRVPVAPNFELDLSYRLRHVVDLNFSSAIAGFTTSDFDLTTHTIQAGLTYKF